MKDPGIRKSFTFKEIMMWSIPALLYAIGQYMYYYILSIVDTPVTLQVFGSLETVIVGVFSVVILKKKYIFIAFCFLDCLAFTGQLCC